MGEITELSVSFLSLVKTPATGKSLTLKSAKPNERATQFAITKTDDDRMIAYGIVYAPDQVDAHDEYASAQTIRRAAYEFMREARLKNIDTEHSFTTEMAYVAESWLIRKGDALFPDEPEGAWAVGIQIGDVDLWKKLKTGDLTGISLAGIGRVEDDPADPPPASFTQKDAVPGWFQKFLTAATRSKDTPKEETDMTEDEVKDIVRKALKEEAGPIIKDALKAAADPAPEGDKTDDTPLTKEDLTGAIGALETKLTDQITKAVAKGEIEGAGAQASENAGGFL